MVNVIWVAAPLPGVEYNTREGGSHQAEQVIIVPGEGSKVVNRWMPFWCGRPRPSAGRVELRGRSISFLWFVLFQGPMALIYITAKNV